MNRTLPCALAVSVAALTALSGCDRQKAAEAPPVVVVAGKVQAKDTPMYLDGLGTVQAFNTVTIHTQVNGVLQKVAFREGQDVKAGDLLAVVDPRPYQAALDQAKARKAEDEAQLSNATSVFERNASLLQKGLVDQQTVDTEKAARDQFAATVQADDAAIEQSAVELGYCNITSPITGRTGIRLVDQGNFIQMSDVGGIVVVTQLKPISIVFTLPQQNWPQVQRLLATGAKLRVFAMGDGTAPLDRGTLAVVDNEIDPATGTIRLKATFPNENLSLWPGQFVNVRLLVETRKAGLVVPSSVIQRGPQGSYVFLIQGDSTVKAVPVQVAQIDGGAALIDKGLSMGDNVVVDGQYKLQDGSKVVPSAPAGPPPGAAKAGAN